VVWLKDIRDFNSLILEDVDEHIGLDGSRVWVSSLALSVLVITVLLDDAVTIIIESVGL
jgi:hypothetical protein